MNDDTNRVDTGSAVASKETREFYSSEINSVLDALKSSDPDVHSQLISLDDESLNPMPIYFPHSWSNAAQADSLATLYQSRGNIALANEDYLEATRDFCISYSLKQKSEVASLIVNSLLKQTRNIEAFELGLATLMHDEESNCQETTKNTLGSLVSSSFESFKRDLNEIPAKIPLGNESKTPCNLVYKVLLSLSEHRSSWSPQDMLSASFIAKTSSSLSLEVSKFATSTTRRELWNRAFALCRDKNISIEHPIEQSLRALLGAIKSVYTGSIGDKKSSLLTNPAFIRDALSPLTPSNTGVSPFRGILQSLLDNDLMPAGDFGEGSEAPGKLYNSPLLPQVLCNDLVLSASLLLQMVLKLNGKGIDEELTRLFEGALAEFWSIAESALTFLDLQNQEFSGNSYSLPKRLRSSSSFAAVAKSVSGIFTCVDRIPKEVFATCAKSTFIEMLLTSPDLKSHSTSIVVICHGLIRAGSNKSAEEPIPELSDFSKRVLLRLIASSKDVKSTIYDHIYPSTTLFNENWPQMELPSQVVLIGKDSACTWSNFAAAGIFLLQALVSEHLFTALDVLEQCKPLSHFLLCSLVYGMYFPQPSSADDSASNVIFVENSESESQLPGTNAMVPSEVQNLESLRSLFITLYGSNQGRAFLSGLAHKVPKPEQLSTAKIAWSRDSNAVALPTFETLYTMPFLIKYLLENVTAQALGSCIRIISMSMIAASEMDFQASATTAASSGQKKKENKNNEKEAQEDAMRKAMQDSMHEYAITNLKTEFASFIGAIKSLCNRPEDEATKEMKSSCYTLQLESLEKVDPSKYVQLVDNLGAMLHSMTTHMFSSPKLRELVIAKEVLSPLLYFANFLHVVAKQQLSGNHVVYQAHYLRVFSVVLRFFHTLVNSKEEFIKVKLREMNVDATSMEQLQEIARSAGQIVPGLEMTSYETTEACRKRLKVLNGMTITCQSKTLSFLSILRNIYETYKSRKATSTAINDSLVIISDILLFTSEDPESRAKIIKEFSFNALVDLAHASKIKQLPLDSVNPPTVENNATLRYTLTSLQALARILIGVHPQSLSEDQVSDISDSLYYLVMFGATQLSKYEALLALTNINSDHTHRLTPFCAKAIENSLFEDHPEITAAVTELCCNLSRLSINIQYIGRHLFLWIAIASNIPALDAKIPEKEKATQLRSVKAAAGLLYYCLSSGVDTIQEHLPKIKEGLTEAAKHTMPLTAYEPLKGVKVDLEARSKLRFVAGDFGAEVVRMFESEIAFAFLAIQANIVELACTLIMASNISPELPIRGVALLSCLAETPYGVAAMLTPIADMPNAPKISSSPLMSVPSLMFLRLLSAGAFPASMVADKKGKAASGSKANKIAARAPDNLKGLAESTLSNIQAKVNQPSFLLDMDKCVELFNAGSLIFINDFMHFTPQEVVLRPLKPISVSNEAIRKEFGLSST